MSYYALIVQLVVCFVCVPPFIFADDILGCGGFVKSEVKINFSLIEVKLYTKQGSLKYQTDCAPNTGYYMIPVYDKGDYVLKVEPPPGWTFEPRSVDLHIDGKTDACSKSEDINFRFTGFGVIGKVISKGSADGPLGVTLTLKKKGTSEAIKKASSAASGSFTFENVLPGEYVVEASHPTWKFVTSSVGVQVGHETGHAGSSLTVFGYDIKGAVLSDGEAVKGVNFLLFTPEQELKEVQSCDKAAVPGFPALKGHKLLCHVASQEDGSFLFPAVQKGNYMLMPFYKGKHITFDVVPSQLKIVVEHTSVALKEAFQVAGFSVSGRVVTKPGGAGVPNASILLNGKPHTSTAADGRYHLDSIKTGQYSVSVTATQLEFETVSIKITPNTPQLADIVVSRFETCGKIIIDKIPESIVGKSIQKKVEVRSKIQGEEVKILLASEDGSFCQMLKPGSYVFKVILGEAEVKAGLKLAPVEKEVQVVDRPVSGVIFSQFRAKVGGVITCLEECSRVEMSLLAVDHPEDKQAIQTTTSGTKAEFQFVDIMPGKYKLAVIRDEWCWKEKTSEIEVTDKDVTDVAFTQSGYVLSCSLSHDVTLNFARQGSTAKDDMFSESLTRGVNKLCLRKPGIYQLTPVLCHQFEQETYTYDTSRPTLLALTAVKHQLKGVIVTQQKQDDIIVTVRSSSEDSQPTKIGPLKLAPEETPVKKEKSSAPSKTFTYTFTYWARAGETLEISAASSILLFYPSSAKVTLQGETCPGATVSLEGRQGVFISGTIQPAIKGVQIVITSEDNELNKVLVESGDKGDYGVGPLDGDPKYRVTAEKDGYMFTAIEGKHGHFKAFKLAEIAVEVSDEQGQPLQGVLLSLSGGDNYRSNSLSLADGKKSFLNLSPGQYFLRPMMKEYKFEPVSRMVDVLEGSTVTVKISSTRVAFSCYGLVTSLNGDSESGVFVEAVGSGSCSGLQEESKTEQDGSFRIRGLQPECEYSIRLRSGSDVNQHIERSAPREKKLKITTSDVTGVHIIAFRQMKQLDLSGNVVTTPEFLPSVKVILYNEKNLDSPLHTVTLGPSSFFYLPSLIMDGQTYMVQLDSTLSKSVYKYTVAEVSFVANTSYKHFTFQFQPKRKSVEQELNTGSYLILPFTVAIIFIGYNYQKLLPFVMRSSDMLKGFATGMQRNAPTSRRNSATPADTNPKLFTDIAAGAAKKKLKMRKT
ncbi:Nodal modulator 2 [Lamellibrachia satsuma]|nr:Nodal modulator 2 [Lamellibrachia satsuma]